MLRIFVEMSLCVTLSSMWLCVFLREEHIACFRKSRSPQLYTPLSPIFSHFPFYEISMPGFLYKFWRTKVCFCVSSTYQILSKSRGSPIYKVTWEIWCFLLVLGRTYSLLHLVPILLCLLFPREDFLRCLFRKSISKVPFS